MAATAAVAFLDTRADINAALNGLIDHRQGGLLAPKVAAKDPQIAFVSCALINPPV